MPRLYLTPSLSFYLLYCQQCWQKSNMCFQKMSKCHFQPWCQSNARQLIIVCVEKLQSYSNWFWCNLFDIELQLRRRLRTSHPADIILVKIRRNSIHWGCVGFYTFLIHSKFQTMDFATPKKIFQEPVSVGRGWAMMPRRPLVLWPMTADDSQELRRCWVF